MKPDEAQRILAKTRQLEGWLAPEAAMLFAWVDEIQISNAVTGGIFEIGVHHGKSAVLLGAMANNRRETLAVCDLFGKQAANVSGSGSGDREVFEHNMQRFGPAGLQLQIFACASSSLSKAQIGNGYRFFHIDGGHNPDEALADLRLAADSTIEAGVIAIDDPFRPEWPGVSEGIFRFLSDNQQFCAIVVGFNKMLLTRRTSADFYSSQFKRADQQRSYRIFYPWHLKTLPFMGHPLHIFFVPTYLGADSLRARASAFYHTHDWVRAKPLRAVVRLARAFIR